MDDNIIITYCLVDDFCKFCEESQKKFLAKPGVQMRKPTRYPFWNYNNFAGISAFAL